MSLLLDGLCFGAFFTDASIRTFKAEGKPGVNYLGSDGILESLAQSQVLAHPERFAAGRPIHLLSDEKREYRLNPGARARVHARMDAAGIYWHPRPYHKRPTAVATSWDIGIGIGIGIASGMWLLVRHRSRIVHACIYVAAVMALALTRMTGAGFVFDMRGFWADHRLDGGLWPREGLMYSVVKWFERRFLLHADDVVLLTQAVVQEIERFLERLNALPLTSPSANVVRPVEKMLLTTLDHVA